MRLKHAGSHACPDGPPTGFPGLRDAGAASRRAAGPVRARVRAGRAGRGLRSDGEAVRAPPAEDAASRWRTDAVHFIVNNLLITIGVVVALVVAIVSLHWLVNPDLQAAVQSQAGWLQFVEAVLIADMAQYWAHRAAHEVPVLWRFHKVHHSIEEMDWLAAGRLHPFDSVLTRAAAILPLYVLGFSRATFGGYLAFTAFMAIFIHANVRFRFGPLRWVTATPEFHHWHHALAPVNKNFAGQLPLLDVVFGTAHLPRGDMPRGLRHPGADARRLPGTTGVAVRKPNVRWPSPRSKATRVARRELGPVLHRRQDRTRDRRVPRHRPDDRPWVRRGRRAGLHLVAQGRRVRGRSPPSCRRRASASRSRPTCRARTSAGGWRASWPAASSTLDILVNNAGATWGAPLAEQDEAAWERVLALNVKARVPPHEVLPAAAAGVRAPPTIPPASSTSARSTASRCR